MPIIPKSNYTPKMCLRQLHSIKGFWRTSKQAIRAYESNPLLIIPIEKQ